MRVPVFKKPRGWKVVTAVLATCALVAVVQMALSPMTAHRTHHGSEASSSSSSKYRYARARPSESTQGEELFLASDLKSDDLAEFEKFFLPEGEAEIRAEIQVEIQAAAVKAAEDEQQREVVVSATMPPRLKTAMKDYQKVLPALLRSYAEPMVDPESAATLSKSRTSPPAKYTGQQREDRKISRASSIKIASLRFPCMGRETAPWVKQCHKTCHTKSGKIPNVIHFILLNRNFGFLLWIAVRSAVVQARADAINIFSTVPSQDLTNCWVRRVLKMPTVHFHYTPWSMFPMQINGRKMQFIQHYSDWLRLAVLWHYGGVYMDTDSIITKPLLPLLHNHAVLSRQATNLPGNGMMIARDHSCFICLYSRKACRVFNGGWASHSSTLLGKMFDPKKKELVSHSPLLDNMLVLKHMKGFFPFSWTKAGLGAMFDLPITSKKRRLVDVYALHLFNFVSAKKQAMLRNFTWLTSGRTLLSMVIGDVLPKGFRRESMNEGRCVALNH